MQVEFVAGEDVGGSNKCRFDSLIQLLLLKGCRKLSPNNWVAVVRGLANRSKRNPADPGGLPRTTAMTRCGG